jgi:hypothetical protein
MKNIVAIFDGLGNQMFHYALALSINSGKVKANDCLAKIYSHHGPALSAAFGIKIKNRFFTNKLLWLVRKLVVFSLKKNFSPLTLTLLNLLGLLGIRVITDFDIQIKENRFFNPLITIYCGRFQNEKYFQDKKSDVKRAFSFDKNKTSAKTREIARIIATGNSVSLHVRRGDYLNEKNLNIFENICTLEYYNKAIHYILNAIENPVFYVFSDDISWAKENLKLSNAFFIDWNLDAQSWEDMYLMSLCKHNIIANSTFSWWGAWLNENKNKMVLCPPKYTNIYDEEFFPDTWRKIYT